MSAALNAMSALRILARNSPNSEIKANENLNNVKVICIPDIIDRFQWFSDNVAISESYARILIERAMYDGTLSAEH